jgi:hypothetical protein
MSKERGMVGAEAAEQRLAAGMADTLSCAALRGDR